MKEMPVTTAKQETLEIGIKENSEPDTEAVAQRCSVKKGFFKISQNPQEKTYARVSFLIKLQASGL